MSHTHIQIGIETVTKATQFDRSGKYQEAIYHYDLSLEHFKKSLEVESNMSNRQLIETKIAEYDKRCTHLKEIMSLKHGILSNSQENNSLHPSHNSSSSIPSSANFGGSSTDVSPNSRVMQHNPSIQRNPPPPVVKKELPPPVPNNKPSLFPPTNHDSPSSGSSSTATSPNNNAGVSHGTGTAALSGSGGGSSGKKFFSFRRHRRDNSTGNSELVSACELFKAATEETDPKVAMALFKNATESLFKCKEVADLSRSESSLDLSSLRESVHASNASNKSSNGKEITLHLDRDKVILHEYLGGGGSGAQIYLATLEGFSFAAKILRTETVEEVIAAIKREIKIMESLDNENIVKYIGHDISDGEIRLYMELYSGTLHDVIYGRKKESRSFTPSQICGYMFQIAKGLNYLHSLPTPILHRDLKSENIFVTFDSQKNPQILKIGDFDSSKVLSLAKNATTFTKNTGTEGFMAPEMAGTRDRSYTTKIDVWSFGMVMYELMMMEKPYFDVPPLQRHDKTASGRRPTITAEIENKYRQLVPFWKLCTKKDPNKRPTTKKLLSKLSELM
eukprot:TRINITY_DN5534_c0_g1_i1.p1 TRINITY_DN5534_c0_g1~~TRINITY_DN5534_c0_g1_i1.p1  ORF type:complete len:562 (+),score=185.52 TRINITY_DN5534_c0_g1_i1:300-1985(+)